MAKPVYPDVADLTRGNLEVTISWDASGEPQVFAVVSVPPTNRNAPVVQAGRAIVLTPGERTAINNFADGLVAQAGAVLDF